MRWIWIIGIAAAWLSSPAAAIDAEAPLADPSQEKLYRALLQEVRCLVCQNQALADSNAPLAADLRREVREQVAAGNSEAEIKSFLTERYGDFVLYKPRLTGSTLLLWLAPILLALLAAVVIFRVIRRRATLPVTSEEQDRPDVTDWE